MSDNISLNARISADVYYRFKRHVIRCRVRGTDKTQEKLIERAISELLDREETKEERENP
jgi:hypothetical protein